MNLATNPGGHSGGHTGARGGAVIKAAGFFVHCPDPIVNFCPEQKGSNDPKMTVSANNNCSMMIAILITDADYEYGFPFYSPLIFQTSALES